MNLLTGFGKYLSRRFNSNEQRQNIVNVSQRRYLAKKVLDIRDFKSVSGYLSSTDFVPVKIANEGHQRVTLTKWSKKENDAIKVDEELCEIDTPDYTYSLTAEISGYLAKIRADDGSTNLEPGDIVGYVCDSITTLNKLTELEKLLSK